LGWLGAFDCFGSYEKSGVRKTGALDCAMGTNPGILWDESNLLGPVVSIWNRDIFLAGLLVIA
jgi:hypothetical protein